MTDIQDILQRGVVVAGCGNLGSHLAKALFRNGIRVKAIYGRNETFTREIAGLVNAKHVSDLSQLPAESHIVFITLQDDMIKQASQALRGKENVLLHCSGAVPVGMLGKGRTGVFYPVQSFSRNAEINWKNLPVCIEGSDEDIVTLLRQLAGKLGCQPVAMNSALRARVHLAAVFASNFSNHMLARAEDILDDSGVDKSILHPLFLYTAEKAVQSGAREAQTGPAMRADNTTLRKHRQLLRRQPLLKKIYTLLSDSIRVFHGR